MNIRPYQSGDYEKIAEMLRSEDMLDEEWDSQENFDSISNQNKFNILIAENQDKIIGSALFFPFGKTAALGYQLVVKKEYRNRGVASALLEEMLIKLKARGVNRVAFDTYADDNFLINFYSKKGFKKSPRDRAVFWKALN